MISHPEGTGKILGGLYALVNREGEDSGRFSETAWMTHVVAREDNEERRAHDDPAMWHLVQYAAVDDFPV